MKRKEIFCKRQIDGLRLVNGSDLLAECNYFQHAICVSFIEVCTHNLSKCVGYGLKYFREISFPIAFRHAPERLIIKKESNIHDFHTSKTESSTKSKAFRMILVRIELKNKPND